MTTQPFIVDYVRAPIGAHRGRLASIRTDDLGATPLRALVEKHPDVDCKVTDDVVLGYTNQTGVNDPNVGRIAPLGHTCASPKCHVL